MLRPSSARLFRTAIPMSLRIYNTLSRALEEFSPIEPGHVRMYVCGMTIYDLCHIGHARMMMAFDVVQRWLRASGYEVKYVRNITDIDDKIIRRALDRGITIRALTDEMIAAMHADIAKLGIEPPDVEPRATEYVPQMLSLIGTLEGKGLAYRAESGDVNYAVRKFPGYGKLSGKSLDELRAGERVAVDDGKNDPLDFVLWKSAKPEEPAEAKWDSSFGAGRPGWHIECSAMSCATLGETFDIHGGGADLQFPHHENEIAQSEGAHGKPLARFWMHNGFVNIDNEKMSKSLGNFFTIREIFQKSEWSDTVTGEMLRYFLLSTHYRSPLDFSDQSLNEAKNALNGFYDLFERLNESAPAHGAADQQMQESTMRARAAFVAAMDDDLNTPNAVAALQTLRGEANKALEVGLSGEMRRVVRQEFRVLGIVLGLLQTDTWRFKSQRQQPSSGGAEASTDTLSDEDIADKLAARLAAKRSKNYQLADQLRAELASHGITIEDRPDGTSRWKR